MTPFLVVDIEATCWPGECHMPDMDIIEIGAVLVEDGQVAGELQSYIRPERNPILSDFCAELTGITQAQVDQAPGFPQVMVALADWLGRWPELDAWGSWGKYDLNHIWQQCRLFQVENPLERLAHHNFKAEFAKSRKIKQCGMMAALQIAGLELHGQHHSALDDARNIARLVCHQEGAQGYNREMEAILLDLCVEQCKRFDPDAWMSVQGVPMEAVALVAKFLAGTSWYGHQDALLAVAMKLNPQISMKDVFLNSIKTFRFPLYRFVPTLRQRLDESGARQSNKPLTEWR